MASGSTDVNVIFAPFRYKFKHEPLYVLLMSGECASFAVGLDVEGVGRSISKNRDC